MSSTNYSNSGSGAGDGSHGDLRLGRGGHWSAANIAAMALGFVVFVPLGLAVLVWTVMGRPVQELPAWLRDKWTSLRSGAAPRNPDSGNVVFNEYQQTQYDRIREIRDEIRRRADAFRAFCADARRRQDQQEFDDFMASAPGKASDRE